MEIILTKGEKKYQEVYIDMWGRVKSSNIHVIGVSQGKERMEQKPRVWLRISKSDERCPLRELARTV